MSSPNYDEIDALLSGDIDENLDAYLGYEQDEDEDIDEILSGDFDEFLSEDEKVYLKNKDYLANASAADIDANFMKHQEELLASVEDVLEEYSGGCMTGEHYGLDQELDEIDELENAIDLLSGDGHKGSCAGCGSHNIHEGSCAGCGSHNILYGPHHQEGSGNFFRNFQNQVERARINARIRATNRQIRRAERRAEIALARDIRRGRRGLRKINRRISKEKYSYLRKKYLRLVQSLRRACVKFSKMRLGRVQRTNASVLVKSPAMVAVSPFQSMTSAFINPTGEFLTMGPEFITRYGETGFGFDPLDAFIDYGEKVGIVKRKRTTKTRTRRRNKRQFIKVRKAQLFKAALICDQKYDQLIRIWRKLSKLRSTRGLPSPYKVISAGTGWLKRTVKRADKLSGMNKRMARRTALLSRRRMAQLRKLKAEERARNIAMQKALFEERKKEYAQKVEVAKAEAKKESQSEYDALLAQTSYIDEADRMALERASAERKTAAIAKPQLPVPVVSVRERQIQAQIDRERRRTQAIRQRQLLEEMKRQRVIARARAQAEALPLPGITAPLAGKVIKGRVVTVDPIRKQMFEAEAQRKARSARYIS